MLFTYLILCDSDWAQFISQIKIQNVLINLPWGLQSCSAEGLRGTIPNGSANQDPHGCPLHSTWHESAPFGSCWQGLLFICLCKGDRCLMNKWLSVRWWAGKRWASRLCSHLLEIWNFIRDRPHAIQEPQLCLLIWLTLMRSSPLQEL